MPHISVECGQISDQQKEQLVAQLTDTAAKIMQVPPRFFSVTIHELPDSSYGIGGETIGRIKARWQAAGQTEE